MKKTVLFLSIMLFYTSCDPQQNSWHWDIKNCTEQSLQLTYPYQTVYTLQYRTIALAPGDTAFMMNSRDRADKTLPFNHYFEWIAGIYGEGVNWQILSEDGAVLKTWNYSDKGKLEQRFFDESSWLFSQQENESSAFVEMDFTWTYEILPEDINQ